MSEGGFMGAGRGTDIRVQILRPASFFLFFIFFEACFLQGSLRLFLPWQQEVSAEPDTISCVDKCELL